MTLGSSAVLFSRSQLHGGLQAQVLLGHNARQCQPGQFFLLRCGAGWPPYLRRALFPAAIGEQTVTFWGDPERDERFRWLASWPVGRPLDLWGPLGRGFSVHGQQRRLVLVAEGQTVIPLLALIEPQLARQGSVGLFLQASTASELLPSAMLPPDVEYYTATGDGSAGQQRNLDEMLAKALAWADLVCAAGSTGFLRRLRSQIERTRFALGRGFAQVLAPVSLPCGVGACLGCLVAAGRGWHRACVRGPVFDLIELTLS